MKPPCTWTSCDGWHRRELGDHTYLMVSRTVGGSWEWRHHNLDTGSVLACRPRTTARVAMTDADDTIRPLLGVAA